MIYDLVIAGGGPAGSSLGLFLATRGWRVALVDDGRERKFKPGEGLVPAVKRIMRDLGIWKEFTRQGHLPSYGNDSLWESRSVQSTSFMQSIDGHGWRLDLLVAADSL